MKKSIYAFCFCLIAFMTGCADYSKPMTHIDDFTGKKSVQCILDQAGPFMTSSSTRINVFQGEIQVTVDADSWLFIQAIEIKRPDGIKSYILRQINSQVGKGIGFSPYLTHETLLAKIPDAPKIFDGATEWRMLGRNASTKNVITPEFSSCLAQL